MRTTPKVFGGAALALVLAAVGSSCACGSPKPGPDGGTADASVGQDSGTLPPELKVTRVLPPRGPSAGGVNVLIEGSGFLHDFAPSGTQAKPSTTIKFGGNTVIDFQIIDDETMEVRVPPGVAGTSSVSIQNPNGRFNCGNCFTYYDELVVTGFTPKEGPLLGGNEVTIVGSGFTNDVHVLFGNRAASTVTWVSATELKVTAPPGAVADAVDLTVYNKNGVSTGRRAYRYVGNLRITGVSPVTGPLAGGTTVTLTGTGFTGATDVTFGALPGTAVTVVSDSRLTVTSPAASAVGAVTLTVVTPRESWSVKNGFTYVDAVAPFAVYGVFPHVVMPGDVVTVTGQGLDQAGLTATLGGNAATVLAQTPNALTLVVPARGSAPRLSDVALTAGSTVTLAGGVTWRVQVDGLSPASGPSAGGTVITVAGSALPPVARVVVASSLAGAVAVTGETSLTATTSPGSGGAPSDVRVSDPSDLENEGVLSAAFTYLEPLAIGRVQPDRGAVAGNTLVTVLGAGFGDSTVISFAGNRAKDVKVVDSHTLTCRTPKGNVGTVDVTTERLTERDELPAGYSYFDPRSIAGGSSGGPLVGTLNITVLDSTRENYGAPIPLATVMLGLDSSTPFQGLTDSRGQITFSDPSLVKAQTVTVFKDLYSSTTVTQVASENLTVFLSVTGGGGGGSGTPPPGTPASTISGKVTGFKAPRPLTANEALEARVFVAQTSLFGGPPFSGVSSRQGETWKLTKDGADYLVATGAGLHATYAVLGIVDATTMAFTPVTMGVKRGITTSPDVPATGENIVLDMQLDLAVPIVIDSPIGFPDGQGGTIPAINSVYAWLDLGAEGFIPNPNNWSTGTAFQSSIVSTGSTLTFPHFPQLDGSNFVFLDQASAPTVYPVSFYFRRQNGPMSAGITIGPLLPTPRLGALGAFDGTISWAIDPGVAPDLYNVQILRQSVAGSLVVWDMVLPGTATGVVLPPAAVDKLKAEEQGNSLVVEVYGSRSPKFSYTQWTYDTLSGVTWSSFTIARSKSFMISP